MPLIEEAKMSEMVEFIGQSLKEAEAADSTYEDDEGAAVDDESSEVSEDVTEEEASPSDTEEDVKEEPGGEEDAVEVEAADRPADDSPPQKDSKWVPRDRLNEVNEKWRQREQQLLVQLGALEERSKHPAPQQAPDDDDDWLRGLADDDAAPSAEIEQLRATQAKVLKWQEDFTRQTIYNEFNRELQDAMEKYPTVPEKVFRDAVVRDGSVNMVQLGEALTSERSTLEAKWRADWEKTQPATEGVDEPVAVRRPARRSTPQAAAPADKPKSYKTIRDAGDAMASEMADFFDSLNS